MNLRKITAVLLALLFVGMAVLPVTASPSPTEDITVVSKDPAVGQIGIDASQMKIPKLQTDVKQKKVIVTGELSPRADTGRDQILSQVAAAGETRGISSIPFGSIIYHDGKGTTTVYDSAGRQLFVTDDANAAKITTPGSESPATFVHEIPSGSIAKEYQGNTFIFHQGSLILTIINTVEVNGSALSSIEQTDAVTKAALTNYFGWIEYAESNPVTADRFESTWTAPTRTPLNSGIRESLAIWNGIERSGVDGVMQPVLMWNFCPYGDSQLHLNYVGAAWDYHTISSPNKDSLHSTPIAVSPGNTVQGTMQWSPSLSCWLIQFKNVATGSTTAFYTSRFPRDNLKMYMAMEASAAGIKPTTNSLTGSVAFTNNIIRNGGSTVPITFTGRIWPGASSVFSGLNPRVTTYPSLQVNLDTGR